MNNKPIVVHWNVRGDNGTLMQAQFSWWRFDIGWPEFNIGLGMEVYPIRVYYKGDRVQTEYRETLASANRLVKSIIEMKAKNLAIAPKTDS